MIRRNIILYSLFTIIIFNSQCNNASRNAIVVSENGLILREGHSQKSKAITTLPFKAKVVIINENGPEETIDGVKGKWVRVDFHGSYGWVFDGFLEKDKNKISKLHVNKRLIKLGDGPISFIISGGNSIYFSNIKNARVSFNTCQGEFTLNGFYIIKNKLVKIKIIESPESIKHNISKEMEIILQIISDNELKVINDVIVRDYNSNYKHGFCHPKKNDTYIRFDQ
jgi:hypothetical protein